MTWLTCNGHDVTWLSSVHDLTCLSTKSTHKAATEDTTRPAERLKSWLCFVSRIILVWRLYQLTIYKHIEYTTHTKLFIGRSVMVNFTVIHSFSINIIQGHSGNCLVLPKNFVFYGKEAETVMRLDIKWPKGRGRAFFCSHFELSSRTSRGQLLVCILQQHNQVASGLFVSVNWQRWSKKCAKGIKLVLEWLPKQVSWSQIDMSV